jgi:hypothetical protein
VLPQRIWASLAAGALGPAIGVFVGGQSAHRQRDDADRRYDLLKRDFEIVSAVNLQLLNRAVSLQWLRRRLRCNDSWMCTAMQGVVWIARWTHITPLRLPDSLSRRMPASSSRC